MLESKVWFKVNTEGFVVAGYRKLCRLFGAIHKWRHANLTKNWWMIPPLRKVVVSKLSTQKKILQLIQSSWNPCHVICNVGVHSWQVLSGTTNSPTDQTNEVKTPSNRCHQRATRITLEKYYQNFWLKLHLYRLIQIRLVNVWQVFKIVGIS